MAASSGNKLGLSCIVRLKQVPRYGVIYASGSSTISYICMMVPRSCISYDSRTCHRLFSHEKILVWYVVSCRRSERLSKYNQLLRIEAELGDKAVYAGENWRFIKLEE